MKKDILERLARVDERLSRHARPLCAATALAMSALLALYNVRSGPLSNLNDIGGWDNRALFIGMTACVQAVLLLAAAFLHRGGFFRAVMRQAMLTLAFVMLLFGINQKTFAYIEQVQPMVRAMDTGGLAAIVGFETNLSAPALTLLYAVTRGPVYDMYLVKLLCIACLMGLALLAACAADRRGLGLRADAVLALCLILPQGFLSAACAAQTDVAAALLLGASLTLLVQKKHPAACFLLYGTAAALSGASLYALPVYVLAMRRGWAGPRHAALALAALALLCMPAMAAGMPAGETFASVLRANFGLPQYASGAPNLLGVFPRFAMEEMPEYFMLRQVPVLDAVTHAQEYYTQAHFALIMRGMTLAGLALYAGLCAWVWQTARRGKTDALFCTFALTLGALIVCPNVSMGAWLLLDVLCIYAALTSPTLRLPACMVLFATAAGCAYPVTEEILLPVVAGFALCAAALCMLLGVVPDAPVAKAADMAACKEAEGERKEANGRG